MRRVPAADIEALVARSVQEHLKLSAPIDDHGLIITHVRRVEVQLEHLVIQLAPIPKTDRDKADTDRTVTVPWRKTSSTRRRELLLPSGTKTQRVRPIRSETRALLVASIARGRGWLDELIADPKANAENIAKRERCSVRKVNMTISLAFLAPNLAKAAIEGRLPDGMGVARLADICRPNGRGSTRCSDYPQRSLPFEPSLCPWRSPFPGNGILRAETNAPKRPW